jgi:hypothetical protein
LSILLPVCSTAEPASNALWLDVSVLWLPCASHLVALLLFFCSPGRALLLPLWCTTGLEKFLQCMPCTSDPVVLLLLLLLFCCSPGRVLLVAPSIVVHNWRDEFLQWLPGGGRGRAEPDSSSSRLTKAKVFMVGAGLTKLWFRVSTD